MENADESDDITKKIILMKLTLNHMFEFLVRDLIDKYIALETIDVLE